MYGTNNLKSFDNQDKYVFHMWIKFQVFKLNMGEKKKKFVFVFVFIAEMELESLAVASTAIWGSCKKGEQL